LYIPVEKAYGEVMKKAILVLVFVCIAAQCADRAQGAFSSGGSTGGVGDDSVNRSLAEEFAKCSAFNDIAAECAKKSAREEDKKAAAQHENLAKRFYRGGYMLSGQDFTSRRIGFHATAMRRNAGKNCEGFPKLEQQYRKRCDDTYRRLPRKLQ
jgi:hypothetical protein